METSASGGVLAVTECPPHPLPPRREKSVLLSSNRKLERKVKELTIQIDDERQNVSNQKDQVSGIWEPLGAHQLQDPALGACSAQAILIPWQLPFLPAAEPAGEGPEASSR